MVWHGPALHFAYSWLIPKYFPGKNIRSLSKQLLFIQTFFTFANIGAFYTFMSLCEGTSPKKELSQKFVPTYGANLKITTLVAASNLYFVPSSLQPLVSNFFFVIWSTYLSWLKNNTIVATEHGTLNKQENDQDKK